MTQTLLSRFTIALDIQDQRVLDTARRAVLKNQFISNYMLIERDGRSEGAGTAAYDLAVVDAARCGDDPAAYIAAFQEKSPFAAVLYVSDKPIVLRGKPIFQLNKTRFALLFTRLLFISYLVKLAREALARERSDRFRVSDFVSRRRRSS